MNVLILATFVVIGITGESLVLHQILTFMVFFLRLLNRRERLFTGKVHSPQPPLPISTRLDRNNHYYFAVVITPRQTVYIQMERFLTSWLPSQIINNTSGNTKLSNMCARARVCVTELSNSFGGFL